MPAVGIQKEFTGIIQLKNRFPDHSGAFHDVWLNVTPLFGGDEATMHTVPLLPVIKSITWRMQQHPPTQLLNPGGEKAGGVVDHPLAPISIEVVVFEDGGVILTNDGTVKSGISVGMKSSTLVKPNDEPKMIMLGTHSFTRAPYFHQNHSHTPGNPNDILFHAGKLTVADASTGVQLGSASTTLPDFVYLEYELTYIEMHDPDLTVPVVVANSSTSFSPESPTDSSAKDMSEGTDIVNKILKGAEIAGAVAETLFFTAEGGQTVMKYGNLNLPLSTPQQDFMRGLTSQKGPVTKKNTKGKTGNKKKGKTSKPAKG